MNATEVAQNNFNSWNRHDADAINASVPVSERCSSRRRVILYEIQVPRPDNLQKKK